MHNLIRHTFDTNDIALSDHQINQFVCYADLLKHWNKKMNLTRIVEDRAIVHRHFLDSCIVLKYLEIPRDSRLVDIGTGAGFPGIPLAIATGAEAVLFDALGKRIKFLECVVKELSLDNVTLEHARAEQMGKNVQYRESFDFAFSRAVTQLPVLLEYGVPLLKCKGKLLLHKSLPFEAEIKQSQSSLKLLNAKILNQYTYKDYENSSRVLVEIIKTSRTDSVYPRRDGLPSKKPL